MTNIKDVEKELKELENNGKLIIVGRLEFNRIPYLFSSGSCSDFEKAHVVEYYLALPGINMFTKMDKVVEVASDLFGKLSPSEIEDMHQEFGCHRDYEDRYVRCHILEKIGTYSKKVLITLTIEQDIKMCEFPDSGKGELIKNEELCRKICFYLYLRKGLAQPAYEKEFERRNYRGPID